jgi:hypothetical protein
MFGTFVFVWANVLTALAAVIISSRWLLINIPDRIKHEICTRLGENRSAYDINVTRNRWSDLRYAIYALIAQCLNLYIMYN